VAELKRASDFLGQFRLTHLVRRFPGSRRLQDFDSALIGYAVATVFASAALVYRYSVWITRPPTWRYFVAGWKHFPLRQGAARRFTLPAIQDIKTKLRKRAPMEVNRL
jgi:hypothetical protein